MANKQTPSSRWWGQKLVMDAGFYAGLNASVVTSTPEARMALAMHAVMGSVHDKIHVQDEPLFKKRFRFEKTLRLCASVEPEFIARVALHVGRVGFWQDMPVLLCAVLSVRSPGLMAEIFDRVIDSPDRLKLFVDMLRSGVVGRRSLGTLPKRLVAQWLETQTVDALLAAATGGKPSLADIIKMVHPKPRCPKRAALYGYLLGQDVDVCLLPEKLRAYEAFKLSKQKDQPETLPLPDVPVDWLVPLGLSQADWKNIAATADVDTAWRYLHAFVRNGVFDDAAMVSLFVDRLKAVSRPDALNPKSYQWLVASIQAISACPEAIRKAMFETMEASVGALPALSGNVRLSIGLRREMRYRAVGSRKRKEGKVRCLHVAAVISKWLTQGGNHRVMLPSDIGLLKSKKRLEGVQESVMGLAHQLDAMVNPTIASFKPLEYLNKKNMGCDLLIWVSPWTCWGRTGFPEDGWCAVSWQEWGQFKKKNPHALMLCVDLYPERFDVPDWRGKTDLMPAALREGVVHVKGYSDRVRALAVQMSEMAQDRQAWLARIEALQI